jgi:hypothetical protein
MQLPVLVDCGGSGPELEEWLEDQQLLNERGECFNM